MDEKRRIMKSYFENALPYLEVFYQPIYDLNKKKLNVAEALLRYDDGHHQNIEQVIRKAEEMGCVSCFDLWVLNKVLEQLPELKKRNIERINVNLSPVTCSSVEAERGLFAILDECTSDKSVICFEITESNQIQDMQQVIKLAEKLMKRGCHVAIDDFGKEESNLLRLMQMPFSVLKIDKAVVWTIDTTSFSKDLISEIIYFLHKYRIQITAEGIENQLQAKELSDMGCDFLQGYLISKPVSFKDFCAFIDAHNKKGSAEMKETPEEKGKNEPQKRKMKKSNIPYDFPVLAE